MIERWTPETLVRAIGILRGHDRIETALPAMSKAFGFVVTKSALDKGLTRRGHLRSMLHLRRGVGLITEPFEADIPIDVDETWDDETDPQIDIPVFDPPPATASAPTPTPPPADRTYVDRGPEPGPYESCSTPVSGEMEAVLAIPDCHHPYADARAWALAVRVGHRLRERFARLRILVMGDFCDCYSVSAHDKDPRRVSQISDEVDATNTALDELDAIGADWKHFIEGNHETRLARHLTRTSPALLGLDVLSIPALFRLPERGWSWCPYRSYLQIGSLIATHDVEHAGVYALHRTLSATGHTVIIGHTHRLGIHGGQTLTGSPQFAASFGWLGDVDRVDYRHRVKAVREWQHGIGVGLIEPSGTVHIQPSPIVDGRVHVMGEIVSL